MRKKIPKIIFPEGGYTDIRFHRWVIRSVNKWAGMQRSALVQRYFEKKIIVEVSDNLDIPVISTKILLLYAFVDISFVSLVYCIRYGIPITISDAESFFAVMAVEQRYISEKRIEEQQARTLEAIKRKIAEAACSKEQAGREL